MNSLLNSVHLINSNYFLGFSIFKSTVGEVSNKYFLDITPAGWAFTIWGVIYIWIGISLIFGKFSFLRIFENS